MHRLIKLLFYSSQIALFLSSLASAEALQWFDNFEEAQQQSKLQNKPIMLVFTGHGWCAHCDELKGQVFQSDVFSNFACDRFVFVELDYNFGEGTEERQRKATINRLRIIANSVLQPNRRPKIGWTLVPS